MSNNINMDDILGNTDETVVTDDSATNSEVTAPGNVSDSDQSKPRRGRPAKSVDGVDKPTEKVEKVENTSTVKSTSYEPSDETTTLQDNSHDSADSGNSDNDATTDEGVIENTDVADSDITLDSDDISEECNTADELPTFVDTSIVITKPVRIYRGPKDTAVCGMVSGAIKLYGEYINQFIRCIATVRGVGKVNGYVKVSDISKYLNVGV